MKLIPSSVTHETWNLQDDTTDQSIVSYEMDISDTISEIKPGAKKNDANGEEADSFTEKITLWYGLFLLAAFCIFRLV